MAVNPRGPDPAGPPPDGDAPDELDGPDTLACGRDAATVWDRAEAGTPPDGHERDCPHCQAARADAAGLDAVVHRIAAQELVPPPSVLDLVMTALRAELRPYELLTLRSPDGPAHLSAPAAASVLRNVVDRMGGLRARSCRIIQSAGGDPARDPAGSDATGADGAEVAITVAARFGVDLSSVTARVRQMVLAAGEQALGVPVRRVDIHVVDVYHEGAVADGHAAEAARTYSEVPARNARRAVPAAGAHPGAPGGDPLGLPRPGVERGGPR